MHESAFFVLTACTLELFAFWLNIITFFFVIRYSWSLNLFTDTSTRTRDLIDSFNLVFELKHFFPFRSFALRLWSCAVYTISRATSTREKILQLDLKTRTSQWPVLIVTVDVAYKILIKVGSVIYTFHHFEYESQI